METHGSEMIEFILYLFCPHTEKSSWRSDRDPHCYTDGVY